MILNKRQQKCLSALSTIEGELAQLNPATAAWHVRGTGFSNAVRLKLTAGDVWQLVKWGFINKHETERRFTISQAASEAPVSTNIEFIRKRDESFRQEEVAIAA